MPLELSPLERACIDAVSSVHWPGTDLAAVHVTRRELTGVGKFVHLAATEVASLDDGLFEVGNTIIEKEGLLAGLDFAVCVTNGALDHIELVTPDSNGWDGVERAWRIVGRGV